MFKDTFIKRLIAEARGMAPLLVLIEVMMKYSSSFRVFIETPVQSSLSPHSRARHLSDSDSDLISLLSPSQSPVLSVTLSPVSVMHFFIDISVASSESQLLHNYHPN